MNHPLERQHAVSMILVSACLLCAGAAPVGAETLQEAACYLFAGNQDCQTVTVVDPVDCIVKVRPRPVKNLDPEIAGCLQDDVQTKTYVLKDVGLLNALVSASHAAAGKPGTRTTVRIIGREILQVLAVYDDNGAPIWDARSADRFEHEGDPARTWKALESLSRYFCGTGMISAGLTPGPGEPGGAGSAALQCYPRTEHPQTVDPKEHRTN